MTELDPRDPRQARPPAGWPPTTSRGLLARSLEALAARAPGNEQRRHRIHLEYPPPDTDPQRFGWGNPPNPHLLELISSHTTRYMAAFDLIDKYGDDLRAISQNHVPDTEPMWDQIWFTGIDASCLYAFVRERRPRRYVEIGSGFSTLFAARAVRDGLLDTRILAVDPEPRTEVEAVCDEIVRARFQDVDPARVTDLRAGDVLVVDSSHYAFMNSDVVAFFLDVLPALPEGVLVGVHDVFLPDDYPWWLADRWYGEQYVLAGWLLGRRDTTSIVLATHFAVTYQPTRARAEETWSHMALKSTFPYGSCFWFET